MILGTVALAVDERTRSDFIFKMLSEHLSWVFTDLSVCWVAEDHEDATKALCCCCPQECILLVQKLMNFNEKSLR